MKMFPLLFSPMVPNLYKLGNDYNIPPTVYALLNSYVNFSKEEPEKIKDLAKLGRSMFFDFEYTSPAPRPVMPGIARFEIAGWQRQDVNFGFWTLNFEFY